ncbi:13541_t:CDS:10 [Ambispora gerdemannii]|uniref:13541_t:CDS:1 n=1 Tax=Ambispora gerdemannii TaxID=144530 RepID=A0A9N8W0C5_9GLOM|nr:13541_t:CDS:10 [Ambispora gerdemannii]
MGENLDSSNIDIDIQITEASRNDVPNSVTPKVVSCSTSTNDVKTTDLDNKDIAVLLETTSKATTSAAELDETNIKAQSLDVTNTISSPNIVSVDDQSKKGKNLRSKVSMRRWTSTKRAFSLRKKSGKTSVIGDNVQSNDYTKNEEDNVQKNADGENSKSSDKSKSKKNNSRTDTGVNDTMITAQTDQILNIEVVTSENMVTTCFHVMMPKGLHKKTMVFVIGNIQALGSDKDGIVRLKRHKKNPMHWYSDHISMPISIFQNESVHYRYFIYKGIENGFAKFFKQLVSKESSENVVPELGVGNWHHDSIDHEFISKENQYDIWNNSEKYPIRLKDLQENYPYLSLIYQSVSRKNLKDEIMVYRNISEMHSYVLDHDMIERFIFKYFDVPNTVEQKIFLCILLGYAIDERIHKSYMPLGYSLPEKFPSIELLHAFKDVDKDDLPRGVIETLAPAVCALVLHISTYSTKFEWMRAFEIAPVVDPKYTFLEHIKVPAYTKGNASNFLASLEIVVKPCMDSIMYDNNYIKVCKHLITLCRDLGTIIFLWQTIFRPDANTDEELHQLSLDHLSYFIVNDRAKELEKHLEEIPVDFGIDFATRFRDRALTLLGSSGITWSKDNIDSMRRLLDSARLNWQKGSALQALKYISISNYLELLQVFPIQLVSFLEEEYMDVGSDDEILGKICASWFKSTLACIMEERHASKRIEKNFACTAFHYLLKMYSIMIKYNVTYDELFKIAEKSVEVLSDDVIFDAAINIGNFKQVELIEIFGRVLKRRFGSDVKNSDNQLLGKIMKICNSSGQQLHIPNTLCEETVFHILTKLQENSLNIEMDEVEIIDDNFHKSLLASSNFWVCILKATGFVEGLHSRHTYVITARQAIIQLARKLLDKSIEINMLKDILDYNDNILLAYFSTIDGSSNLNITKIVLQYLRDSYEVYMNKLNQLDVFYKRFCAKATDVKEYLSDLTIKLNMQEKVTFENTLQETFWKFHQPVIKVAQHAYTYAKSQTFRNVFEKCLKENEVTLTVELIVMKYMRAAFSDYNNMRAEYKDWATLECSKVSSFWKDVELKNIDHELELISRGMNWRPKEKLKEAVSYLAHINSWRERLEDLERTLRVFRVRDVAESWLANVRNRLLKEPLTLLELFKAFNEINKYIYNFNDNCWKMVGALSYAGDLISWLQTIVKSDLRNLINGVDEKRDVQEETVATLLEVKQFLEPLMNDMVKLSKEGRATLTIITKFLEHVRGLISKNNSLPEKVTQCCSSSLALQNIYSSILNRGEETKERIRDAMTKGSYKFNRDDDHDKCVVNLFCKNKSGNIISYDLSGIRDLQGQALLIAKQAASAFVLRLPVEKENSLEQGTDELMEFVQQVDTVHQIIKYASQLMELGHFVYREWSMSASATENLMSKLEKLKQNFHDWEKTMKQAQEKHYYLTFYTARHILTFYDYFSCKGKVDSKTRETCEILLRFVSKGAKLPPNKGDIRIDAYEMNFDWVLCEIGKKLYDIFTQTSKYPRKIRAKLEPIVSDVVYPGKLFVAACADSYRVPNIILSLYANHGSYPEPWQLLMCRTTTTAEELSLFIKRCFLTAANGYNKRLFCIAGLEFLEFELQYKLVNDVRNFQETNTDYYLALICCKENGIHHHILDQFSERMCITNGLGENTMKNMYMELCSNVFCVTSELSGQGKTEYIKNAIMEVGLISRSLSISDNIHFDELVQKLKECKLRPIESMHLNIMSVDNPNDVNVFLFELLTLGIVSNKVDIVCLPKHVFIEIASTENEHLLKSIPIAQYLKRVHLKWNINDLIVSHELMSPIQIVSSYLDAHDRKMLSEKDISFTGKKAVVNHINPERCHALIQKYFLDGNNENITSYRFVEIFLNVFADQLIRLSSSSFFNVDNLRLMVDDKDVRTTLMTTLLEVSKYFATRSVATKAAQLESTQNVDNDRLETIVQWDASNHHLVFFLSQTPDSICALYRDRNKVPPDVKRLLLSQEVSNYQVAPFQQEEQKVWELDDYHTMSANALLEKLELVARRSMRKLKLPNYALSADNLLKMALILLRARANIPVVICGEAGCGKTSLIGFLAAVVEVKVKVLSLHAGIREDQIHDFMKQSTQLAMNSQIWLFFDEINTCNHIGLLADLIAHRTLSGRQIHHNIRLFAACNPYRFRKKSVTSVGLEKNYQEQSKLVYQVHPLPDQILDYVWDYGVLKPEEEKAYIRIMVESRLGSYPVFVDLLCESQKFIRMVEEPYTVSLRDVKRAIKLVEWFQKSLKERPSATRANGIALFMKHWNYPPKNEKKLKCCSFVLSLGLCYQSRLYDQDLRKRYRECMAQVFKAHKENISASAFQTIIRKEQEDFMQRMVCPPSTADNDALLENVLVMIVCCSSIDNVTFDSSKSLAVRLISSNLRGEESEDDYFKTLPQVFFISHQGSASSTSAGILKVFDTAEIYQRKSSEAFPVQAVVLLDEVGLSETSRSNPLKVLHALLEPGYSGEDPMESLKTSVSTEDKKGPSASVFSKENKELPAVPVISEGDKEVLSASVFNKLGSSVLIANKRDSKDGPTVSVVGISNWRLDNSKSSRALLVQRPKFGIDDLTLTASMLLDDKTKNGITDPKLRQLADAYLDYEKNQKFKNFHGLRDYYALVKSLSGTELTTKSLELGLIRNFGGTDQIKLICEKYFGKVLKSFGNSNNYTYSLIPVERLINENLNRKDTRHLMVIGKSDSLVNILTYHMRAQHMDPVVLCGSQFPDDNGGDYLYAVLSRIMMCVEAGRPLILTDLDIIYGSLYDLWNQNYISLGSRGDTKYFARVALGAYSNPMLYVHPDFKCILVMDENKLEHTDPPLLNRFEKQRLTINDILSEHHKELFETLDKWVFQISTLQGATAQRVSKEFTEKDIFMGFDKEETIQSLVFDQCKKEEKDGDDDLILKRCKERLIAIASADGIVRARQSILSMQKPEEVAELSGSYFNNGLHDNIESCLRLLLGDKNDRTNREGQLVIINTFSNINTNVKACLNKLVTCQVDKLSTFKTEAQLQDRMKRFWLDSDDELLVIQCDLSTVNSGCIKLAKFIIEQIRTKYLEKKRKMNIDMPTKHACIILHINREQRVVSASFDFMCGWNQITVGTLTPQEKDLPVLLDGTIRDIIDSTLPFEEIFRQELMWCLLCIKYPSTVESVDHIKYLVSEIPQHPRLIEVLKQKTLKWLDENTSSNWQLQVASDKKVLYLHSSFSAALRGYIRILVRKHIAKLLCTLERLSALKTLLVLERKNGDSYNYLIEFWYQMFADNNIINTEMLTDPKPDLYRMASGPYTMEFPFSCYLIEQINHYEKLCVEDIKMLEEDENNIDTITGKLLSNELADCFERFQNIISKTPALVNAPLQKAANLYINDFLTVISSDLGGIENFDLLNLLLLRRLGKKMIQNPIRLHTYWWTKSDIVIAELQLAKLCPSIRHEIAEDVGDNFENFKKDLPSIATKLTLDLIREMDSEKQLQQWQLEVSQVLPLCSELSTSLSASSLQLLNICNDLVSMQVIPSNSLSTIIELGHNYDISNRNFTDYIFQILDKKDRNGMNIIARQAFVLRILDTIPLESPARLHLYENLLAQAQPPPFTAFIIRCIFRSEERDMFSAIFRNADEVFYFSPRLNTINKQLGMHQRDSHLAALCCDVIQKEFYAKMGLHKLVGLFQDTIQLLCANKVKSLQLVCSIALLKQFVQDLWSASTLDKALNVPIEFNFTGSEEFLVGLNNLMRIAHPQIQSLKFYFLKILRARGLSMNDLKQFHNIQQETLPWLSDLQWNKDIDSRLPFNPYFLLREYEEAENAMNGAHFNDFLGKLLLTNQVNLRIAFVGFIVARLYAIQATRNLNENENEMTTFLQVNLGNINISPVYKRFVEGLLANDHPLLQINRRIDNTNLIIRLVIVHIIAVHASLPANHSPLTLYLHKLQEMQNTYILTCPSDEDAILMGAITEVKWYRCVCGYKYVVSECGQTMQARSCPAKGCHRTIGGQNHISAAGQTRLDDTQVQNAIANREKTGYIMEAGTLEQGKNVREMTASSYRILHLFVHALIVTSAHSQIFFNNIANPIEHCLDHITKDWEVLKTLLNCDNENLALILHDILHSIAQDSPTQKPVLTTSEARTNWECQFTTRHITNRARNPAAAATNLRNKLQRAKDVRKKKTTALEGEINETLTFDNAYSARRLPRLWRRIGDTSLDNFRTYYLNNENHRKNFPFISIYFEYEKRLPHLKHIHHLVKFVRILFTRLSYRIKRDEALHMTFQEFIDKDAKAGGYKELQHSLKAAFNNFAKSWNAVMPLIERYQCHDLPANKPKMNLNCQIVFGLVEGKDAGLFLCAALEYLVDLQNRFLRDIMNIPSGTCHSLKFIEQQTRLKPGANSPYHIKSVRLEDARQANFIDYEWNPKILEYSQRNLDIGRGVEIEYDLYKIEAELARDIIFKKTYLEPIEQGGLILEPFPYCMEMFQDSTTIFFEIKQMIKQEPISQDLLTLLTSGVSSNYSCRFSSGTRSDETILSDNESELLSALELLLCFVKRTAGSDGIITIKVDGNITIKEYISQWMKLSVLTENKELEKVLNVGLRLKHVIALYELVEGKVADIVIESINTKYKTKLTEDMENEILTACSFEEKDVKLNANLIPAEAFMLALKRFTLRKLSVESICEDHRLLDYLEETTIGCWPDEIDENLISDMFPPSLLLKNTHAAYHFTKKRIEMVAAEKQITLKQANIHKEEQGQMFKI